MPKNEATKITARKTVRASLPDESRLRLPKAGELVARKLRNRIVRGDLREGEILPPENELVQQFGVSRPTLREAIRILESERLVEVIRGLRGGARILKPSVEVAGDYFSLLLQSRSVSLTEVYKTRVLIEPGAVRLLAVEQRPEAVAALREALVRADSSRPAPQNALAFSRFHQVIIEQTRNEALVLIMGMLNSILDRYLVAVASVFGAYIAVEAETERANRSCLKLIEYIEHGESDRAAILWRRYLNEAEEKLRRWQPSELVVDLLQND